MNETVHDGPPPAHPGWQAPWQRHLPLERETALFIAASAMDFLMTWVLLNTQSANGRVWFVESNPIARYFLYSWGFDGLVLFKMATVLLVAAICQVIARTRAETARRLLVFATLAVLAVVGYSALLLVRHT